MISSEQICSECGQPIKNNYFSQRKDPLINLIEIIRDNSLVKNESSLEMLRQIEYHISDAFVLLEEVTSTVLQKTTVNIREDARVKVDKNVIKIIGHLLSATDCSTGFPELHAFLLSSEKNFIFEGQFLDINLFIELLEKEKMKFF